MRRDADGAAAELAASQHGVISRTQAADFGLPSRTVRNRLDAGLLGEPVPGVLVYVGSTTTFRQQLMIATLARGGGAVVSHRAAALLHGFDGVRDGRLEVSVIGPRRFRVPGVIAHEVVALDERDVVVVDGLPTTGKARTLCDLGAVADRVVVAKALDSALRSGSSRLWIRETAERLHRPGPAGTGVLLGLLEASDASPVADSWFERSLEVLARIPGLPQPVRQHVVRGASGEFVARVDLGFPSIRLALEAHSRSFHFGPFAEARDEDRDHRLARVGWDTLYVGWQRTTTKPRQVAQLIESVVRERASLIGLELRPRSA